MDGKGVNGNGQALGVDLGKLLASRIIPEKSTAQSGNAAEVGFLSGAFFSSEGQKYSLEEMVEHLARHLLRSGAIDLVDLFSVGKVGVEPSELAFLVAEQQKEMGTIASVDDIQHSFPSVTIDSSREHDVFNSVEHDGSI